MKPRNRAKLAVRRSPVLWTSYVSVRFPTQAYKDASDAVCLPHHDVLLDGYPRSANSYVYNFVTRFLDGARCVHHAHASATLKMAARFDVPAFVLIRKPLDAVTSNVIRSGGNLPYHEAHYEQYYTYVLDHIDDVDIVPFDTATQDPVSVLNRVEAKLGLPPSAPSPEEIEATNAWIEEHLEHVAEVKYGEDAADKKAVPDEEREVEKARLREQLADRERIQELEALYETVRELSGTSETARVPPDEPQA